MPALERFASPWFSTRRFLTFLFCTGFLLILPQCSEKNSADYVGEGLEYIEQQDFDKAETAFLKAIENNSKNPEAYYGVGGFELIIKLKRGRIINNGAEIVL